MKGSDVINHNFTMSDSPVKGSVPHDMELFPAAGQPGSDCRGFSLGEVAVIVIVIVSLGEVTVIVIVIVLGEVAAPQYWFNYSSNVSGHRVASLI